MKRKIKKIYFEVISNSKIININFFFNQVANDQYFAKLTEGLDKGGGETELHRIRYYYIT